MKGGGRKKGRKEGRMSGEGRGVPPPVLLKISIWKYNTKGSSIF